VVSERLAQQALGHNSKAVHRAYAKHAEVTTSLEDWERNWQKNQPQLVIGLIFNRSGWCHDVEMSTQGENDTARPVHAPKEGKCGRYRHLGNGGRGHA
jgi:hypothetical protein